MPVAVQGECQSNCSRILSVKLVRLQYMPLLFEGGSVDQVQSSAY